MSTINSTLSKILMESNGITNGVTNGRMGWIIGIRLSTNIDRDASTKSQPNFDILTREGISPFTNCFSPVYPLVLWLIS